MLISAQIIIDNDFSVANLCKSAIAKHPCHQRSISLLTEIHDQNKKY